MTHNTSDVSARLPDCDAACTSDGTARVVSINCYNPTRSRWSFCPSVRSRFLHAWSRAQNDTPELRGFLCEHYFNAFSLRQMQAALVVCDLGGDAAFAEVVLAQLKGRRRHGKAAL